MAKFYYWLIFFAILFTGIRSANCNESEEESEDFDNDCPDHYFWVKNEKFKSGKRKGESRWLVTSVIQHRINIRISLNAIFSNIPVKNCLSEPKAKSNSKQKWMYPTSFCC